MKTEAKTKMVPRGTSCFGSKSGHYNFHYPSEEQGTFKMDAVVKELDWICGDKSLKAIQVKSHTISGITLFTNGEETVVWVQSDTIQRW